MTVVIDASAVLAILQNEPGADLALSHARGALLSAVTYSEILVKLSDKRLPMEQVTDLISELDFTVIPFGEAEAIAAAALRPHTLGLDISFGDRACLSLALQRGLPLLNADHDWAKLDLGLDLRFIRPRR